VVEQRLHKSPDRPGYRVEALAKGLRILSLFDEKRPSWRIADLTAATGQPSRPSTEW
jgi:IclR family transcriptional regulator, pca regulon regulatory protein